MSHSITLFNELSLTSKVLILVNHADQPSTKIRIRKSEILSLRNDESGYKLNYDNTLAFMENHLAQSRGKEKRQILNQFLQEIKQADLKSRINVQELQKSGCSNQSRILTAKIVSISA